MRGIRATVFALTAAIVAASANQPARGAESARDAIDRFMKSIGSDGGSQTEEAFLEPTTRDIYNRFVKRARNDCTITSLAAFITGPGSDSIKYEIKDIASPADKPRLSVRHTSSGQKFYVTVTLKQFGGAWRIFDACDENGERLCFRSWTKTMQGCKAAQKRN